MNNPLSIALVMPVYNEESCIEDVTTSWRNFLGRFLGFGKFVMIIVNDGSHDNTGRLLEALGQKFPELEIIHQQNAGHGSAVVAGYRTALAMSPEYVFQVDSDNQFFPEDFALLWDRRSEADFILGLRQKRQDSLGRRVLTRTLRAGLYVSFGIYADVNSPFRLMRAGHLTQLLTGLPDKPTVIPNIFLTILAKQAKSPILQISVRHKPRTTGKVSILRWNLFKFCWISSLQLCKLRVKTLLPENTEIQTKAT
ncbi:MAG: glycosyltransferase family 2 protein [Candidatus Doudnabacteria bacterium]|nr:glycosyltransferase family 2 protein [Candidatus Doudnabacteria bacterium]